MDRLLTANLPANARDLLHYLVISAEQDFNAIQQSKEKPLASLGTLRNYSYGFKPSPVEPIDIHDISDALRRGDLPETTLWCEEEERRDEEEERHRLAWKLERERIAPYADSIKDEVEKRAFLALAFLKMPARDEKAPAVTDTGLIRRFWKACTKWITRSGNTPAVTKMGLIRSEQQILLDKSNSCVLNKSHLDSEDATEHPFHFQLLPAVALHSYCSEVVRLLKPNEIQSDVRVAMDGLETGCRLTNLSNG